MFVLMSVMDDSLRTESLKYVILNSLSIARTPLEMLFTMFLTYSSEAFNCLPRDWQSCSLFLSSTFIVSIVAFFSRRSSSVDLSAAVRFFSSFVTRREKKTDEKIRKPPK